MKLLSAEINYYSIVFIALFIPLLIFTAFGLSNVQILLGVDFFDKYFWSTTVGLMCYIMIYGIHASRVREMRERVFTLLPVKIQKVAISRFIFGVFPFIIIGLYLELLRTLLTSEWSVTINRIHAIVGLQFILLSIISILFELKNTALSMKRFFVLFLSPVIFIVIGSTTFLWIYSLSLESIKQIIIGGEELYFYVLGIIYAAISNIIFLRRNSYFS